MLPLPWNKKDREVADRLKNSLDSFPEVQKNIQSNKTDAANAFIDAYERMYNIVQPQQKPSQWWIHFTFVPIIFIGIAGAGYIIVAEKTNKDNQPLKQQALTVLGAALTGAVGFYVGKK